MNWYHNTSKSQLLLISFEYNINNIPIIIKLKYRLKNLLMSPLIHAPSGGGVDAGRLQMLHDEIQRVGLRTYS